MIGYGIGVAADARPRAGRQRTAQPSDVTRVFLGGFCGGEGAARKAAKAAKQIASAHRVTGRVGTGHGWERQNRQVKKSAKIEFLVTIDEANARVHPGKSGSTFQAELVGAFGRS